MTPCEFALFRYRMLALWRNLWSILLFAFAVAIVLFSIVAILFFLRSDWLTGAVNAVGSVASGLGMSWVVARRSQAVEEERDAANDVYTHCKHAVPAPMNQTAGSPTQTELPRVEQSREAIEAQLTAITNRLTLFGHYR
jgi:uncharacterized membrane protein YcjF (UPF0283 family)